MSFADALRQFAAKTERSTTAVHQAAAVAIKDSWLNGSAETGAPPLPMATGDAKTVGKLRRGVRLTYPDPNTALIYTTVPYAEEVEDNPRGVHFTQGGAHGFKLTVAAFPHLIETVTKRIVGGAP